MRRMVFTPIRRDATVSDAFNHQHKMFQRRDFAGDAYREPASLAAISPRRSLPDEGDLFQRLLLENLDALGDVTAARAGIEGQRVLVVFQRPYPHAFQAMVGKTRFGCRKQPPTETDAL